VEPEALAIELSRAKFNEKGYKGEFINAGGYSYPFPDGAFDMIVCADVIEHVDKPIAMLTEIRRLLKPGGAAVISTPIRISEKPLDRFHVQEWYPAEFAELCKPVFGDPVETVISHPVFWFELYKRSFNPGFTNMASRYIVNLMAALGKNVFLNNNGSWRFFSLQTYIFRKQDKVI